MAKADDAVRNYLLALRDPKALADAEGARELEKKLSSTEDPVERVRLRQRINDAKNIDPKKFESDFVTHAKAWADKQGISYAAFQAEGVNDAVLRRAGFSIPRGAARRASSNGGRRARRSRVSADEVRKAIPSKGTFTIRTVAEASGASTAVVRRVVQEEIEAGRVKEQGTDTSHPGPGRAPSLYAPA